MDEIEDFYENYDEWNRLERHKIEFEITKKFFDKYIPANSRILDIGGGPGRYSIYLASRGHKVTLLDLTKKHIEIAKDKAEQYGVQLEQYIHGNALELPKYNLGQFDVILLMGPLYHLTKYEDRQKAVADALALLKPGGIIAAAFISAYATILDTLKRNPLSIETSDEMLKYINNGIHNEKDNFTTSYFMIPVEARRFMSSFKLTELAFAGVEGFSTLTEEKFNELPKDKFDKWLDVIYRLSEDPQTFAVYQHYLYIGTNRQD